MATEVYVNIKDLPEITEVNNGEYILVETATGTHIIDFKNFVLPTDNTVITTAVSANGNAIANLNTSFSNLSTYVEVNVNSLSSVIDSNLFKTTTLITTLCDKVTLLSPIYVGKCNVIINGGGTDSSNHGSGVLTPTTNRPSDIETSDIMVFPANEYASKNPVYVSEYNTSTGQVTLKGNFTSKTLLFNEANLASISKTDTVLSLSAKTIEQVFSAIGYSETNSVATENAIYNVLVVKKLN